MLLICAGMLRSGSTLQYNICSEIVERTGTGQREGFFVAQEMGAFIHQAHEWALSPEIHVIKTHDWLPSDDIPSDRVQVLYVYRDVASVAQSARRIFGHPLHRTIENIEECLLVMESLENDERALIQNYKKLVKDMPSAIEEIGRHLGVEVSPQIVQAIVEATNAEHAKKKAPESQPNRFRQALTWARGRGLFRLPGKILRASPIPDSWLFRLRRVATTYDSRTLYHQNHIAVGPTTPLSDQDIELLNQHFAEVKWFKNQESGADS